MASGFYIHKNAMDCYIEILKVQYQDSKRIKARVRWWVLGYTGNPWVARFNDPIEIKLEDFKNNWIWFMPDLEYKTIRERIKNA